MRTLDAKYRFRGVMVATDSRVNVSVSDRILAHLWEQDHQADHYLVTFEMTRPGIAEVCALHLPNVSRSMRELISDGLVSEHTRAVRGEERRQKTWQLTEEGRKNARNSIEKLRSMKILIRDKKGKLLEIRADEASKKLQTELTLLQVLMHAQHEGVLNFGDIRFGAIIRSEEKITPGSISLLSGAHSTYHTRPPETREVHGRSLEKEIINKWYQSKTPMFVLSGIAGCGKTTLVSFWMGNLFSSNNNIQATGIPSQNKTGKGAVFLIDSGVIGETAPMVEIFMKKMKEEGFRKMIKSQFIRHTDACVDNFLNGDLKSLFYNTKQLSKVVLNHFKPMIPKKFHKLWASGLESNDYYLKLCGSGGGGYILGFTENIEKAQNSLSGHKLEVVYTF